MHYMSDEGACHETTGSDMCEYQCVCVSDEYLDSAH